MTYGQLNLDTIQSSTTGTPTQFNDGSGTQIGTLCRAWVKWNYSTGSIVVNSSFNVTSITLVSTGLWLITFTNALVDANYAIVGNCSNNSLSTNYGACLTQDVTYTNTTTACRVATLNGGTTTLINTYINSVAIFR